VRPLGIEDQCAINMCEANKDRDLIVASSEMKIIPSTTIDQLPKHICRMVEEKNASNAASTLAGCLFNRWSSTMMTQFKVSNIQNFISHYKKCDNFRLSG
jgi:hypothetical protein